MLTIAKLFGKSPFTPLQTHIKKVSSCIDQLPLLFAAIKDEGKKNIKVISKKISKLEHEADLVKNDIRNHLPKSLFMPIGKDSLLGILSLQDSFADKAEDIGILAMLKPLEKYEELKKDFEHFSDQNIKSFYLAKAVIKEFDSLLETSFGGMEAQKVKEMIDNLAYKEHEIDLLQYDLMKKIYDLSDKMHFSSFYHWMALIKEIGSISNISEKLGNRIRMILDLK